MIFPIWQPLASSSHLLAQECAQILGEKATHTGTLDPMAEGVLVVLTGDDRFAKGHLPDWEKEYEFSILWGITTDSYDKLGVIKQLSESKPAFKQIQKVINNYPTQFDQLVPPFSALRWNGQSGFELAAKQEVIPEKYRGIHLSNLSILGVEELPTYEILKLHAESIKKVQGNFRQTEILNSWKEITNEIHENLLVTHHFVKTTPGTYIRQLVFDLAKEVEIPAVTWSITRTKNGPYEKLDCVNMDELNAHQ